MTGPKVTLVRRLILRALLNDPDREMYGLEISAETGVPSGSLYPALNRLAEAGGLLERWEDIDPVVEGRRPRHYYRLNRDRLAEITAALDRNPGADRALRFLRST